LPERMYEQFSVHWKYFVNVFMQNKVILLVNFSNNPVENVICSETSVKLRDDLTQYFSGKPVDFTCYEVMIGGFTARVLKEVRGVGYGEVTTYGELAKKLKTSPRAVGQALKRNPAPVVIPCHRVVSKNSLGGYSSGENIKKLLLELEGIRLFGLHSLP